MPPALRLRALVSCGALVSLCNTQCIVTVAGNGLTRTGSGANAGDGGPAWNISLNSPQIVNTDGAGGVLILETLASLLRRVFSNGTAITVAGTGVSGYSGDYGPATLAMLNNPVAVAVDGAGGYWCVHGGGL